MGDIRLARTLAGLGIAALTLVGCQADSKADLHSLADTQVTATVTPTVTATAATRTPTASATPTPTVARTTAKPAPKPVVKPTPKPVVAVAKTDPRFGTCKAAKAAGYGPYRMGIDPEYYWYRDADHDGIDCE